LEVDEAIGARAHRLQVGRRLARLGAPIGVEEVPGDDHASRAAERIEPERRGVLEHELRGVAVDLLDPLDVAVGGARDRRGRRVGVKPSVRGVKPAVRGWAATPAAPSIWAASGPVRPRPTMIRVNARRDRRPARTSAMRPWICRSSMTLSSSGGRRAPVGGNASPQPGLLVGEDSRGPARSAYYSKRPSRAKPATGHR